MILSFEMLQAVLVGVVGGTRRDGGDVSGMRSEPNETET